MSSIRLHHAGFVVKSLSEFEKFLLYEEKIIEVIDPVQYAKLALYKNFSNSFIELIEPLSKESFTWNSLEQKGNHFNHFCYEIIDESELELLIVKYRLIPIMGPIPALLFDNRMVWFFYNRNKQILEFIL